LIRAIRVEAFDPMPEPIEQRLDTGLEALGLALTDAQRAQLLTYLELLQQWNAVYNLTAIRDPLAMVDKHLLDSLAVLPHLDARSIGDIGSGAGLPGIPLAIARPGLKVALLESAGKKARFLREVQRALALANVGVFANRAELWRPAQAPDAAIARAVAPLAELTTLAAPWLAPGGTFYAMKGPGYEAELDALPAGWSHHATHSLLVPGLDAERVLVVLKRARSTGHVPSP
jgi:16S rRNA (guanine527-N7)-methyltransferase